MSSRFKLEGMSNDDAGEKNYHAAVEEAQDAPPLLSEPEALPPLRASRGSRGEHPFYLFWQKPRRASIEPSFARSHHPSLSWFSRAPLCFYFKRISVFLFFFSQVSTW
jgi:hypothetical protein